MIEKIYKIQRLLVVEKAYPDIETAKANIKSLNLLADLKAEIKQLILSGVSYRRELLACCPICSKEMTSQLVKHHHCKKCKEHYTS
tara:strand:+ start:474 stop:731 length:258 start_codon:yes stop_codon:yes gene_type:complete